MLPLESGAAVSTATKQPGLFWCLCCSGRGGLKSDYALTLSRLLFKRKPSCWCFSALLLRLPVKVSTFLCGYDRRRCREEICSRLESDTQQQGGVEDVQKSFEYCFLCRANTVCNFILRPLLTLKMSLCLLAVSLRFNVITALTFSQQRPASLPALHPNIPQLPACHWILILSVWAGRQRAHLSRLMGAVCESNECESESGGVK